MQGEQRRGSFLGVSRSFLSEKKVEEKEGKTAQTTQE